MLKDNDRIFKNLYNDYGWKIDSSIKIGDWKNTKDICSKGKEWIINEIKASELGEEVERDFQLGLNCLLHPKKQEIDLIIWL